MCLMNQKPVVYAPCNRCPEFLNSCMPIVVGGFLWGECDQSYCEWCGYYGECFARNDDCAPSRTGAEERSYSV